MSIESSKNIISIICFIFVVFCFLFSKWITLNILQNTNPYYVEFVNNLRGPWLFSLDILYNLM